MASYLNPGSKDFYKNLIFEIYVDKSGLIEKTNSRINTRQKYVCVSRPSRFGKSMAADMLAAYYDCSEDVSMIFDDLNISNCPSYKEHLNKYDVIKVNMQTFLSMSYTVEQMLDILKEYLLYDLLNHFHDCKLRDTNNLVQTMRDIYGQTNRCFVIIIDQWDSLFREYKDDQNSQKKYLDFLRLWLKDQEYVALAYMTGILPIKKYGSHSALNMFTEYSMTDPGDLSEFFVFTEKEVKELCEKYQMNFDEAKQWYDGYKMIFHDKSKDFCYSMYSPKSVVEAMLRHRYVTYWNQTETYEALKIYIQMDIDGLKQSVIKMLSGESVVINTGTFSNDMITFYSKDDILTLLVHLGYLTYNSLDKSVSIPNEEVQQEYLNVISMMSWDGVISSISSSKELLENLWSMNNENVAQGIDKVHQEISIIQYNDENSLSCVINLAFYYARQYYNIIREFPTGKGYVDIVMIPRKIYVDKPAIIIELKWDKSTSVALNQIKEKNYPEVLKDYKENLLIVAINYNKVSKKHECSIKKG